MVTKPRQMITTKVFQDLMTAWVNNYRRFLAEGGTSSSKTYSVIEGLILINKESPIPLLTSMVSETLPHLKRGVQRDFFNILGESTERNSYFNKTEGIYSLTQNLFIKQLQSNQKKMLNF